MLPTVQTWTPLIARFGSRAAAYERDADPQCRRTQAATGRAGNWSMGHGSMGHMGHGSRHGDPWPINLVTDMNGRDGFFGQVREAIVSLPRSRVALVCLSQVPVSHMTTPPLLMLATYHPLRNGKLVRLTGFIVLQSQLVFHQHLQPQHLWHRWRSVYWEKSEVVRLNRYCVMLKVQMYPLLSDCSRRLFVIPASSAECERHFSAFNARNIITSQRNMMFPETAEALSIVLEGYKNKLIQ